MPRPISICESYPCSFANSTLLFAVDVVLRQSAMVSGYIPRPHAECPITSNCWNGLVGAGVVALRRNKINAPDTATRVTLLEHHYRIRQSYERMLADAPREQDQFAGPVSGIAV